MSWSAVFLPQVKTLHIVRALKDVGCRVVVTDYQPICASRVSSSCDAFHTLQPLDAEHLDHWVEHLARIRHDAGA